MKIKANKDLFERWRELGSRIGSLASIVQNDTEVTSEQILEWLGHVDFSLDALMALRDTTVCYCFSMNTEDDDGNLEIEKPIEVISV